MNRLDDADFQYTTNTTIVQQNYKSLPALAKNLSKHNIYFANFLFFMHHYEHSYEVDTSITAKYSDIAPYLREAVDILEAAGKAVAIRYAPLCTIAGLEKNYVGQVGVRHDPHEWMNNVEHQGPGDSDRESKMIPMDRRHPAPGAWLMGKSQQGPFLGRGNEQGFSKVFGDKCQGCSAMSVCDGVDKGYFEKHGDSEMIPYMFDDRGQLLDKDRLAYLAGHVVKLKPGGKPSKAVKRLLHPTPIKDKPLVSFIVPNFNHGGEIERCLDSIVAQTYPNIEVIVVDDCSTDDSKDAVYRWLDNNRMANVQAYFRSENAGRPAIPRNDGLKMSRGDILCCIDPDDWILPSYVEECVRMFKRHPEASIVYTGAETFGMETVNWVAAPFNAEVETKQNFIGCYSLFRREVYEDVGGFDEDPGLKRVDDYEFWVAAVRLGHYGVALPRQLVRYHRSEGGLFESEVKPNSEAKHRLIHEKNQEVYDVEFLTALRSRPEMIG